MEGEGVEMGRGKQVSCRNVGTETERRTKDKEANQREEIYYVYDGSTGFHLPYARWSKKGETKKGRRKGKNCGEKVRQRDKTKARKIFS